MKKITTIYLEETLKDKAKGLGLNLSRFLERKLQDYLRNNDPEYARVTGTGNTNYLGLSATLPSENRFLRVPAFAKHKRDYGKWLISRDLDDGYIKDLTNTLTCFISEDLTDIPDNISEMQVIALRNYLNYLVQKSLVDESYANSLKKGLPLKESNPDNFIPSDEMVREAFGKITEKRYQTTFKLLAFSGARITEIVRMLKEFNQSKLTVEGNFAKYQLHYNRGKKHSFFIYFPSSFTLQ